MIEHENPKFENNAEALYIQRFSGNIVLGQVIQDSGKNIVVETSISDCTRISEPRHPSEVFSLTEAASVAGDLLPAPADGEERLLRDALDEIIASPATSDELKIRLESEAANKRFSTPRTDRELGVVDKEQLLGSLSRRGSNIWKINEMLEGIQSGIYSAGATNELNLAQPNNIDLSLLPKDEATRIQNKMDDINRTVLNELYENYYVDFANASVWERNNGDYLTRKTIYPVRSGLFSFIETHLSSTNAQPVSNSPLEARIVVGIPSDLADQGFTPAI